MYQFRVCNLQLQTYSPSLTVATTASAGACQTCDSDYAVFESVASTVITVTCVALPTGCADITDCMQVKCFTDDGGTTYSSTCNVFDLGKGANATNTCTGTIITNCDYASFGTDQNCMYVSSGYAVANDSLSAIAYTTDSNCQRLVTGITTQCQHCWDGYYWKTTICLLSTKLLGAAFLAVIALIIN
jgi:hypothetical protein